MLLLCRSHLLLGVHTEKKQKDKDTATGAHILSTNRGIVMYVMLCIHTCLLCHHSSVMPPHSPQHSSCSHCTVINVSTKVNGPVLLF